LTVAQTDIGVASIFAAVCTHFEVWRITKGMRYVDGVKYPPQKMFEFIRLYMANSGAFMRVTAGC